MPYYKFEIEACCILKGNVWAESKEEAYDKLYDYESNLSDIDFDDMIVDETECIPELYKEEE